MFNEGKTPMIVFGERLDHIYKKRKIYGKLPKYCQNLFPEESKYKYFSYDNINSKNFLDSSIMNNDLNIKKQIKKDNIKKTRNNIIDINKRNVFIDFEKNNFVDNINNTGKDFLYFKIKLRKMNPLKNEHKDDNESKNNNKSYSYKNIILNKTNNILKIPKEKEDNLNNLYLNKSPFKKIVNLKDEKKYIKKWNHLNGITFNKITGREKKKINSRLKSDKIEGAKNYFPNYSCILSDTSKTYVSYGKNRKKDFKKIKSGVARKIICNSRKLFNNLGDNYNIINFILEEKRKKDEEKMKRIKKMFGDFYDYWENKKNFDKLGLEMFK